MYMDKKATIAVIISLLVTVTAFGVFSASSPKPNVKISEAQALAILEDSTKVNKSIIGINSTKSIELRYAALDWGKIIDGTRHLKLFVTRTPVGEVEPYYFIESRNRWSYGWQNGEGTYIVDAQTGELLFAMENIGGGISVFGFDYNWEIEPSGWNSIEQPTVIVWNAETVLTLKLVAATTYDASLPIAVRVRDVPQFVDVVVTPSSGVLNTGSGVDFKMSITPHSDAPVRFEIHYDMVFAGNVESHNNLYFMVRDRLRIPP
jgi:hypothetical protein